MSYLNGGIESGFRHVITKEYTPRLLHVRGDKLKVIVSEVTAAKRNLDSNDVFLYDTGTHIVQWIGKGANKDERYHGQQFAQQLSSDRNGKVKIEVVDEDDTSSNYAFCSKLSDEMVGECDNDKQHKPLDEQEKQLYRISDETGTLKFEKIANGNISRAQISEDDVFIIDNGLQIFVYIGERSSRGERKNALIYAHNYLKETEYPFAPISVVKKDLKGNSADQFNKVIGG